MSENIPKPTIKPAPPSTTVASASPPPLDPPEVSNESPEPKDEPESTPASGAVEVDLMKRFLGVFIDAIVAAIIAGIVLAVTGSSLIQTVTYAIIFLVRDSLPMLEGQSIGKKVMKTKAVKEDGSSLSADWVTGATRNILLAIPLAGLVECFIILTRSGKPEAGRRLGDDWAKTKVISVD